MRVVLDANVVVSGIFWSGPPHRVLRHWLDGSATLLTSEAILVEYRDVLLRLTSIEGADIFAKWNRLLTELSEFVEPERLDRVCRDPDDQKYLEAAVGGRAQLLVSGDKDLVVLGEIRGIPIVTPQAAVRALRLGR